MPSPPRLKVPAAVEQLAVGAALVTRLPGHLRHPIGFEQGMAILSRRVQQRETDFLALARRAIFTNPANPYQALLALAGCEYGDLERLVRQEGLEGALRALYLRGVYLTVDEFKRGQPAVRGSQTIAIDPASLRNPTTGFHFLFQSSGSRGARTWVPVDLNHIRERSVDAGLYFHARGGADWVYALWGVAGGWPIVQSVQHAGCGLPIRRWFSQADFNSPNIPPIYRWSARALRASSLLAGVPLPRPEPVPVSNPLGIADWLVEVLRSGRTPHLHAFASPTVQFFQAAAEAGYDLRGVQVMLAGEPTTPARAATIRRTGAEPIADYGTSETGGFLGYGCLSPEAVDDCHFFSDLHGLIQVEAGGDVSPLPPGALLVTSLRPTAPMALLNVSLGDQARMARRHCGCPVDLPGWDRHFHTIRSFEKLTAGGAGLLDLDVVAILEEVLPTRFGGGPGDYQLLEDEDAEGRSRLRLLVDPSVDIPDDDTVVEVFLSAIERLPSAVGRSAWADVFTWREGKMLQVERRAPLRTASGKIHHVHLERSGYGAVPTR